ncbi:hypothetical protein [Alkalibacter mobilis]|uniref:hypothetical protein n=1 Tax=Alkalibacter mobilis TaxID=2787712 RepID=UPI0018A11A3D|nr:hypothetical protein [Alkalibacter mobilis]MBF7097310.1 hypothetical protein [Alkalibacter mobilis]
MTKWIFKDGRKIYNGGQNDYHAVSELAISCGRFSEDYEEERMAEEDISCYNCRFRRWIADSFECMKNNS